MPNDEIKKQCYELLWGLFGDKCPVLKKFRVDSQTMFDLLFRDNGIDDQWTILTEILPAEIRFKTHNLGKLNWYFRKFYYEQISHENIKELQISYKSSTATLFASIVDSDFWQALYSLLEAIQNHPDFNKMEFK